MRPEVGSDFFLRPEVGLEKSNSTACDFKDYEVQYFTNNYLDKMDRQIMGRGLPVDEGAQVPLCLTVLLAQSHEV